MERCDEASWTHSRRSARAEAVCIRRRISASTSPLFAELRSSEIKCEITSSPETRPPSNNVTACLLIPAMNHAIGIPFYKIVPEESNPIIRNDVVSASTRTAMACASPGGSLENNGFTTDRSASAVSSSSSFSRRLRSNDPEESPSKPSRC